MLERRCIAPGQALCHLVQHRLYIRLIRAEPLHAYAQMAFNPDFVAHPQQRIAVWNKLLVVYTEVDEKILDYLQAGTRLVIIVNPREERVTVYRSRTDIHILTRDDVLEDGEVLPGWSLPVSAIFA